MAITDRTNIPKITVSSNKYGTSFNDVNKEMPNIQSIVNSAIGVAKDSFPGSKKLQHKQNNVGTGFNPNS